MRVASKISRALRFQRKKSSPALPAQTHSSHCANCSCEVASHFCPNCGQAAHVHHSLLHLIEEVMHGLWHFDAKGWKTIPLLVAYPGELTRRYIDGQRVRFISPLALFLFTVFILFFVFSLSGQHLPKDTIISSENGDKPATTKLMDDVTGEVSEELAQAKADVSKAEVQLALAKSSGANTKDEESNLKQAKNRRLEIESELSKLTQVNQKINKITQPENKNKTSADIELNGEKWITNAIKHYKDNPELVIYKIKSYAYKFALILVPISLPFLWLMFFWRKNITMFDHAIFSLYSLSFMALLMALASLLDTLNLAALAGIVFFFVPPIHMFRQLQGTYQLSFFGTFWRTCALLIVASTLILLFLVLITGLSVG